MAYALSNTSQRTFKFFHLLAVTSITIQLACNCIVGKFTTFFYGFLPASALIYPVCYALGDIIADVYGYSLSRELIWLNIYAQIIFGVIVSIALLLPSPQFWSFQPAIIIWITDDLE